MNVKKLLLIVTGIILIFTACENPFFPEKNKSDNSSDDPQITEGKKYKIVLNIRNSVTGDMLTVAPDTAGEGGTITLSYTVANTALYNRLDFGGVSTNIASVENAVSGERKYTVKAADVFNGEILIIAVFTHTNLEIDQIAFENTEAHITVTYGSGAFTNAITNAHHGTGAITYSSSDGTVAAVSGAGVVTILKAGTTVITAEKAADAVYARAEKSYTLTVAKVPGAAVTTPVVNGTPTINSITVNTVSLQTATGQSVEYAISTANNGTGLSAWQNGTTFTGLNAGTVYYVYARSASNTNYEAGTTSVSAGITIAGFRVTFESNGGSAVPGQNVAAGGTVSRPANPIRSGYVFDTWYQDDALTIPYYFGNPVTENITLYAKWISNTDVTAMTAKDMVWIPGGTFTMGSPASEPNRVNDETQHTVTLSGFYMGKYQITQEKYQAVTGSNPSGFTTAVSGESGTPGKLPVETVRWYDALVFCNRLSMAEGLSPAYSINGSTNPTTWGSVPTSSDATWNAVTVVSGSTGYRLPTEAQWEYACRAGTTTAYNTGDTISDMGWYSNNSVDKTHQVGLKPANAWGLYDMHGNVHEWCWDWYGAYAAGAQTDPMGASSGTYRVYRGGYWRDSAEYLRSAYRYNVNPFVRVNIIGFRLVRPQV